MNYSIIELLNISTIIRDFEQIVIKSLSPHLEHY